MGSNPDNNNSSNPVISGALTYPRGNELSLQLAPVQPAPVQPAPVQPASVQPPPVQPRQPRNLQGLLRFAMEATKAEDAPGNSDLGPMDEERRKFLEEAMKSLTVDVVVIMQNSIKVLTDQAKIQSIKAGDTLPRDVVTAFHNLMEYIDDINVANDFFKLGGFAMFPICFSCENAEVRANACWVLAVACQNNPYCQLRALSCGLLHVLLSLLRTERGVALAKCLHAVACVCRECPAAARELVAQGGCSSVVAALSEGTPVARVKAACFIQYLLQREPDAREELLEMDLVKLVVDQVKSGYDAATDHVLAILAVLLDIKGSGVMEQLRDPTLGLREVLQDYVNNVEEQEWADDLLNRVFKHYEIRSDEVER